MPNHVTNQIRFSGLQADVNALLARIRSEEREIDFQKIIPMPEVLTTYGSGSQSDDALDYYMAKTYGAKVWQRFDIHRGETPAETIKRIEGVRDESQLPELLSLGQKMSECLKLYGSKDWYNWSVENWGTKWNAYDIKRIGNTLSFNTAWSFPERVVKALAALCHSLRVDFQGAWADEDTGCNTGRFESINGVLEVRELENRSKEAYECYLELHGENECLYQDESGNWRHYECGESCPHYSKCY